MADGQVVFEITADGKHAIADIKEITKAIEKCQQASSPSRQKLEGPGLWGQRHLGHCFAA